jgi:hypothetical protein
MKENKIPTAEEFYKKITGCIINHKDVKTTMIEFTKLHVAEALKEVKKNIKVYIVEYGNVKGYKETVEESILNAYPLNNIK